MGHQMCNYYYGTLDDKLASSERRYTMLSLEQFIELFINTDDETSDAIEKTLEEAQWQTEHQKERSRTSRIGA